MTTTTTKTVHFTITGEFITEHSRNLFVEDKPKDAVQFLTTALIGMPEDMAWDVVLGKTKVTGDSNEGCGIEEDTATEVYGISLSTDSVWNRLAKFYFNSLGELQCLQRRIMILGNADDQTGALYRFCGFEIWNDYIITLKNDREVYLKKKEKFDNIVRQLMFVGLKINKSIADLPIVDFEVPSDLSEVEISRLNGYVEHFSLEYLLKTDLVNIKLPDDSRKIRYKEVIDSASNISDSKISAVDSYLKAQRKIDKELKEGIKPTPITEPKSAGWIAPNGDYYGLDGDIANMLHNQIASALFEAGIVSSEGLSEDDLDKKMLDGNPDSILSRTGWVKVHGHWILYDGYELLHSDSKSVPITDEQIHTLYLYGQHLDGWLEFGYQRHRVTACTIPDIDKSQYPLRYFRL
jgi:hypothetical protein